MKREYIEVKIKGKTQNAEHILYHYDRYYHEQKKLKIPYSFFYDQFVSEKVLDNILTYMDRKYENFIASIASIGFLKNDLCYFNKTAFTNNIMNKFLITSENTQFAEFFNTFNEVNKVDLKGMVINCAMLEYNYIQQKSLYEKNLKALSTQPMQQQDKEVSLNQPDKNIKEKCAKLIDELQKISDKINLMNMRAKYEDDQRTQEKGNYKQRKQRLNAQFKTEDETNKKLLRMTHEVSAQKKMLEQQKQNLIQSFSDILQKEVQKKLKDYQDMLRAKHKEEILKLEQTYNFDITKRKKITQDMSELQNSNQNMIQSIESTKKVISGILIKQKEKINEFTELKIQIQELDQIYKIINSQNDKQNDIMNCKLCNDKPAQIIFRPCGHLIYCESCWIDYLTDERDPYINHTKYMCLICLEFRNICKIEGLGEKKKE